MRAIAKGGVVIYGAPLGILMLDARFPRIPGAMANAMTRPFPVLYRVVRGVTPERVVLQGAEGLLDDIPAAAAALVADGAEAITTNYGFLSLFQRDLAAHSVFPLRRAPWSRCRGYRRHCLRDSMSGSSPSVCPN